MFAYLAQLWKTATATAAIALATLTAAVGSPLFVPSPSVRTEVTVPVAVSVTPTPRPATFSSSPTTAQIFAVVDDFFNRGLSPELAAQLRGPKGDKGDPGSNPNLADVQGPPGYQIGAVYPTASYPNSAGTIAGVTHFGSQDMNVQALTVSGTATIHGLSVTSADFGSATFTSLTTSGALAVSDVEVSGIASISNVLYLPNNGTAQITGNTNIAGTLQVDGDINVNSGTLQVNGDFSANAGTFLNVASISGDLEVLGTASVSYFTGAGLTSCTGVASKLLYNATTKAFSCGIDSGASGTTFDVGVFGSESPVSSLSFNPAQFTVSFPSPTAFISLDWGAGGPASLSQDETVSGAWTFNGAATFTDASASGVFEATALKALTFGSDSVLTINPTTTMHISPGSGITDIVGIASISSNLYALGNVGIGITVPTANLHIKDTTSDSALATMLVANSTDETLLQINDTGTVGIGSAPNTTSALHVNTLTRAGAENVSTSGSSTTITTTNNAFAEVNVDAQVTANGETRYIVSKTDNNTAIVDVAVDWTGGYAFTFKNPSLIEADGSNADVRGFVIAQDGSPIWQLYNWHNEDSNFMYLWNDDSQRDVLTISDKGRMSINQATVRTGSQSQPFANLAVYPTGFDAAFFFSGGSSTYTDLTTAFNNSEGAGDSVTVVPNIDFGYLGMSRKFSHAFHDFITPLTTGTIKLEYWNGSGWVQMGAPQGYVDGTNGMTQSGDISWDETLLTNWTKNTVNGETLYWVRISWTALTGGPLVVSYITPDDGRRFAVFQAQEDSFPALVVNNFGRVGAGDSLRPTRINQMSGDAGASTMSLIDTEATMRIWSFSGAEPTLQFISGVSSISNDTMWSMHVASASGPSGEEQFFIERHGVSDTTKILTLGYTDVAAASRTAAIISSTLGAMDGSDRMTGLSIDLTNSSHAGAGNQVRALNIGGITPSANASESAIVVGPGWDYAFVASQGNVGLGTTTPETRLEVVGIASMSQIFGAGLTNCSTAERLYWDSSAGKFSCISAATLTGVPFAIRELGSAYINAASMSFSSSAFTVTDVANDAVVSLDYASGPASRSIAQTITGHWNFTTGASVSAPLEVSGALTASSSFSGAGLTTCNGTTQKLTWINGQFGCGVDQTVGGGGSGIMEIREWGGAFDSFPASLSFSASGFNLTASGSSDVTIALDYANGPASRSIAQSITGQWAFNAAPLGFTVANSASISKNLEITGYASASQYFGTALPDCSSSSQKLLYNNATGAFTCGTDAAGGAVAEGAVAIVTNPHDLHFDAGGFNITASTSGGFTDAIIALDYSNGPASRSAAQTITGSWNFTGGASVSNTPFEVGTNAFYVNPTTGRVGINTENLSEALEVVGNASVSGNVYASAIGLGTSVPTAGFRLDSTGPIQMGNGTDTTQTLIGFNVGHSMTMLYGKDQFGQSTLDGLQIRNTAAESNLFTVYGSRSAQIISNTQGDGFDSQFVAMSNPNVANLTAAAQGLFTNKATTHDIAVQYRFGTGTPIDAMLIDTNPTANTINSIIINNGNQNVSFRVAGQNDVNLLYADGSSKIGIGTSVPLTKLEVEGTASASNLLAIGGLQIANGASASYSRFGSDVTTHALSATSDLLISGKFEVDGLTFMDTSASVSNNFEVAGAASASQTFGSGLTDCDSDGERLNWTASGSNAGKFSCKSGSVTTTFTAGFQDAAANTTNVANIFTTTGNTAFSVNVAGNTEVRMNTAGYISSCMIIGDANVTAGTIGVVIRKNGATVGATQYCQLTTTVNRTNAQPIPAGAVTFVAGDTIGVAALTSVGFTPTNADYTISFTVTYPTGADIAETYYTTSDAVVPGSVVAMDTGLFAGVRPTSGAYDENAIGVISTAPGVTLGDSDGPGRKVYVALAGRVPVWVSSENGPIMPGDWLTAASIPGAAMKATQAGRVIGQALVEYSGNGVGQTIMFVKNAWYNGATTQAFAPNPSLIDGIVSALTNIVLTVKELVTDRITANTLCLQDVCVGRDQLKELLDRARIQAVPSATPTPSPSETPTPTPDATVSPTPLPSVSETPTPPPTVNESPSPSPSPTISPISESTPVETPMATSTPEPSPSATP